MPILSSEILFSWPHVSPFWPQVLQCGSCNSPSGKSQPGHPSVISVFLIGIFQI